MAFYTSDKLRNVCVAGHGTSGKTTLVESLLFHSGVINRQGTVEAGNTVSDFTEEETNRGISISAAVCSAEYRKNLVCLVDVPGYFDFSGELAATMPFCESALLTVKGTSGLDVGTEKAFALARRYGRSIAFFVNEMDKENLAMDEVIDGIESTLGIHVAPLSFPASVGPNADAVADVLKGKVFKYTDGKRTGESALSGDAANMAAEYKTKIMEAVAESDEALMEKYFADGALSDEEINTGLIKAFAKGSLFPLFFGAPNKGIGTDLVLDAIVDFFPTPAVKNELIYPDGTVVLNPAEAPRAIVFKVNVIPQFGEVFIFKVLSGEVDEATEFYNANSSAAEKFGQLFVVRGKDRVAVSKAVAGQIAATVKLKSTKTGDQFVKDKNAQPLALKLIEWPEAIVRGAFVGESKEDADKVATNLRKMQVEDASFRLVADPELKQLFVDGLGELHLEVLSRKLRNQYKLNVRIEEPKIPYRETIRGSSETSYRHKKQTGGSGQFAEVHLRLEPNPEGFEFVNAIVGGVISGRFIPAVEKGVREVMEDGVFAGCKFINCRVTLFFGKEHEVDSNEMAFKIAASQAFKDAVMKAKPVLLEPLYTVEVEVPDEYAGAVMGDISSRRGKPQGMDSRGRNQVVKALVPLKEIHGYSTKLRSMTNGRGLYTISFSHYDPVPPDIQQRIMDEYQKSRSQQG
ncbi:MAG TPA: elongation factor G [bacterium]|nr:elongation factor G [bacterium]